MPKGEFNFKKKYGQNFLIDNSIIEAISNSIKPKENDLIIEIGTGIGFLTKRLVKYNSYYIGFEIDKDTINYLKQYENNKTKFIIGDFLKVDLNSVISDLHYQKIYIVGNLPYYITTPIIEKIIDSDIDYTSLTIMVQKEVGDRFLAKPNSKKYGYFTVLLNYFFEIEKIISAPRTSFNPMPNVDSVVLKLTKKTKTFDLDYEKFKLFIKDVFKYKRKNLKNNLKNYDLNKIQLVLEKHNLNLSSRAENLSLEVLIELFKSL